MLDSKQKSALYALACKDQDAFEQLRKTSLFAEASDSQKCIYGKYRKNYLDCINKMNYGSGGGGASTISIEDFKRAKYALEKANVPMSYVSFPNDPCSLDCLECKTSSVPTPVPMPSRNKEKETTMRDIYAHAAVATVQAPSDLARARAFASDRLDSLYQDKKADLRTAYHMDTVSPKTVAEFIAWIKDGNFTVAEGKMDKPLEWRNPQSYMTFGPAKDEAGYDTAKATLKTALQDARDIIALSDEATALSTLQGFKTATFH